ncbi:DUF4878 domain-containing protein [Leptotrichia alba]|uniref:DUF4878 domain-containing protein n=1 Tax=Leptotrichia alba TaxID=3239304 RepID=A0AB39V502_9FUSO
MRKVLLGMLMFLFVASCGSGPNKAVSKFIDNIKAEKFDEAAKYTTDENFKENMKAGYNNEIQQFLFKTLLENIEYKIIKTEKQDDETSIVTVEIKTVDMQKIFLQLFKRLTKGTFSKDGKSLTIEEIMREELESKNKEKTKNVTQFVVKKTEDGEKVVVTAENIDIMLGKLNTTLSNLNTLGNTKDETAVELPETGPSTGVSQKPEELRNQKK